MLQGSIQPPKTPVFHIFFHCFSDFHMHKVSVVLAIFTCIKVLQVRHAYLIGTFCFVQIDGIQPNTFPSSDQRVKNVTGPIQLTKTPLSSPFFHSFNDFYVNKGSAGEAHPTHWYHLFRFGPKDRSHTNEFKIIALFILVRLPFFLPFFAILTIFTTTMPLYAREIYVNGIYNFVLVHRIQLAIYLRPDQRVQNAIRHYLACQDLCFQAFFDVLSVFTILTYIRPLCSWYTHVINTFCSFRFIKNSLKLF